MYENECEKILRRKEGMKTFHTNFSSFSFFLSLFLLWKNLKCWRELLEKENSRKREKESSFAIHSHHHLFFCLHHIFSFSFFFFFPTLSLPPFCFSPSSPSFLFIFFSLLRFLLPVFTLLSNLISFLFYGRIAFPFFLSLSLSLCSEEKERKKKEERNKGRKLRVKLRKSGFKFFVASWKTNEFGNNVFPMQKKFSLFHSIFLSSISPSQKIEGERVRERGEWLSIPEREREKERNLLIHSNIRSTLRINGSPPISCSVPVWFFLSFLSLFQVLFFSSAWLSPLFQKKRTRQ